MKIANIIAVLFISLISVSWCLGDGSTYKIAASLQNELGHQEPGNAHALSRAKRHIGYYGYGVPYYGLYRRPYPVPVPILIGGGGFVVGRGYGFGGRGFGGRGFGGRGFGGRGIGGRGIGGRGGFGGGRGGRG